MKMNDEPIDHGAGAGPCGNIYFPEGAAEGRRGIFRRRYPNRSISHPTPNVSIPTAVRPNSGPIEIFVKKSRMTFKVISRPMSWTRRATIFSQFCTETIAFVS